MNFILNRTAIKGEARNFISQNTRWWKMTLATLLVYFFSGGISYCFSFVSNIRNGFFGSYNYYQQSMPISFSTNIIAILMIPFSIAAAGYYLNHIRGFNPQWQSLYKEGFDRFGKYLLTGFLTYLFTVLWSLLFIIPGIVMGFAYSQAKYIIHDNPGLDSTEAIKISKIITKGYKGDLFMLYLSFFGWYILTGLTAGILGIYVVPYVETTSAMYYENLKRNAIDTGLVAPEAFGIIPQAPYGTNQQHDNFNYENPYSRTDVSPEDTFKPGDPDNNNHGTNF